MEIISVYVFRKTIPVINHSCLGWKWNEKRTLQYSKKSITNISLKCTSFIVEFTETMFENPKGINLLAYVYFKNQKISEYLMQLFYFEKNIIFLS